MSLKKGKTYTNIWAFSLFQGTLFLFLVFFNIPFFSGLEAKAYTVLIGFKRLVLTKNDDKMSKDSIVFINISKSLVIDSTAHTPVTDRRQLSALLAILSRHPKGFKYAFFDVLMQPSSPADSAILGTAAGLGRKVLFTAAEVGGSTAQAVVGPEFPTAPANFNSVHGLVLNYPLVADISAGRYLAVTTAPLRIYQDMNPGTVIRLAPVFSGTFVYIGAQLSLRDPFIEPRFRPIDLQVVPNVPPDFRIFDLNYLLANADRPNFFKDYLKDKMIIVGQLDPDNDSDVHQTVLGNTFGPLLVLNSYLGIVHGEAGVNMLWLLFMLMVFVAVSAINLDVNLYHDRGSVIPVLAKFYRIVDPKTWFWFGNRNLPGSKPQLKHKAHPHTFLSLLKARFYSFVNGLITWTALLCSLLAVSYWFAHFLFHFLSILFLLDLETEYFKHLRKKSNAL